MIIRLRKLILPFYKLDKLRQIEKSFVRSCSTEPFSKVLECLTNRSLLKLTGKETPSFLQGLTTNDMRSLEEGVANVYTLFLNIKGRVMYDAIVYKANGDGIYYVECDAKVAPSLMQHLKMYRLRRKIDIEQLNNDIQIWSLFDPGSYSDSSSTHESTNPKLEGLIFPCNTLDSNGCSQASKMTDGIIIYKDPRLHALGFRILVRPGIDKDRIIRSLNTEIGSSTDQPTYRGFLYKLGIGEGINDLEQGKSFPLEINCDYLHGISFHKGCYVGQELTARTYHTGVIRKRLMPLIFTQTAVKSFNYDQEIVNESGKKVGKFRGNEGQYGLALMRIAESLSSSTLTIGGIRVKVVKPSWWPQESERAAAHADNRK